MVTSTEKVIGRWKEHFEELLNLTNPPSMVGFGCFEGLSWLTRLINIVWKTGAVPKEWQTGVVVPLFNKGDQRVGGSLLKAIQSLYTQSENCVGVLAVSRTHSQWGLVSTRAAPCHLSCL